MLMYGDKGALLIRVQSRDSRHALTRMALENLDFDGPPD